MGRFVKNTAIKTASNAIRMPFSSSVNGPTFPVDAQVRVNTGNGRLEVYFGGAWSSVATVGRVPVVKDEFSGDGGTDTFIMTHSYTAGEETALLVFIGNVFQNPGVAYNVSGTNIVFTSPPDFGTPIVVLHNFSSTGA